MFSSTSVSVLCICQTLPTKENKKKRPETSRAKWGGTTFNYEIYIVVEFISERIAVVISVSSHEDSLMF